jgi:hypothetical protein
VIEASIEKCKSDEGENSSAGEFLHRVIERDIHCRIIAAASAAVL